MPSAVSIERHPLLRMAHRFYISSSISRDSLFTRIHVFGTPPVCFTGCSSRIQDRRRHQPALIHYYVSPSFQTSRRPVTTLEVSTQPQWLELCQVPKLRWAARASWHTSKRRNVIFGARRNAIFYYCCALPDTCSRAIKCFIIYTV